MVNDSLSIRLRRRLFHWYFLLRRPMTMGARIVALNHEKEVLLVRHTYVSGWHFPGGGIERRQTGEQAARDELLQETGFEPTGGMTLFNIYFNRNHSPRDHVLLYCCDVDQPAIVFVPNREIAEIGFFALDALPKNVGLATRRRLDEIYGNADIDPYW